MRASDWLAVFRAKTIASIHAPCLTLPTIAHVIGVSFLNISRTDDGRKMIPSSFPIDISYLGLLMLTIRPFPTHSINLRRSLK